jgi:hypothetical protein
MSTPPFILSLFSSWTFFSTTFPNMAFGSTPPFRMAQSDGNRKDDQPQEEEDYMSMTIESPNPRGGKETFTQKWLRKQREVSLPSFPPLYLSSLCTLLLQH